jgi:hypothetical protein
MLGLRGAGALWRAVRAWMRSKYWPRPHEGTEVFIDKIELVVVRRSLRHRVRRRSTPRADLLISHNHC